MSANTPQNYFTLGQAPLDAKLVLKNKQAFFDLVQAKPVAFAFDFYKGMLVYFQEDEKFYIWESPFSEFYKENDMLLDNNYIYPLGSDYDGLDYSDQAYNLIELTYNKENLGVWDEDDVPTIEVVIYANSTVNPFDVQDVLDLWPNAERISFIDGNITGLKLNGQTVQMFQEFPISEWANLSYNIWNTTQGFMQEAKMRIIMPGEVVNYDQYKDQILGNSFKEAFIVHDERSMKNKNSIYFKTNGDSFEIHVVDRLNVKRKLVVDFPPVVTLDLKLELINNVLKLIDNNSGELSQVSFKIENILALEDSLKKRILKPITSVILPDSIFQNILVLDQFGNSANASFDQIVNYILHFILESLPPTPDFPEVKIENTDNSINIQKNAQNDFTINSALSFFEEEFDISQNPSMICVLHFVPTSIIGVYNNGYKLSKDYYEIISLQEVKILPNPYDMGNIIINYYHKIN